MTTVNRLMNKPEAPSGAEASPAAEPAKAVTGRTRIPLSTPRQTLEAPKIPGYVCQWFVDRPGRIMQAQQAGYQLVSRDEIYLNNQGVADDPTRDGNTDLGNAVSTYAGVSEQGSVQRLYLMKIPEAWWLEDQKVVADRNESVADAIRGGMPDTTPNPNAVEADLQYGGMTGRSAPRRRTAPNIFTRKRG